MGKVIIVENADGTIGTINPTPERKAELLRAYKGDEVKALSAVAEEREDKRPFKLVDEALVPDNYFRDAWAVAPAGVGLDFVRLVEIAHSYRRGIRDAAFAPLDQAMLVPIKSVAAEAARQILRDTDAAVQAAIDAAPKNAETIKQIIEEFRNAVKAQHN